MAVCHLEIACGFCWCVPLLVRGMGHRFRLAGLDDMHVKVNTPRGALFLCVSLVAWRARRLRKRAPTGQQGLRTPHRPTRWGWLGPRESTHAHKAWNDVCLDVLIALLLGAKRLILGPAVPPS